MKDNPTVIWSEIVINAALEFLTFEKRTSFVCEFVEMISNASASGIRNRIDTDLDLVDEVEEWF